MNREITDHIVDHSATDNLKVEATDAPRDGAYHRYRIIGFAAHTNPSYVDLQDQITQTTILFQNGPVPTNGVNGVTQEALLAIVADRLRCFQNGPYPSANNAEALAHVEAAIECLHRRTRDRMARQVEGKEVV